MTRISIALYINYKTQWDMRMEEKNEELNEEDMIPTEEELGGLSESEWEIATYMFTNSFLYGGLNGYKGSDEKDKKQNDNNN